MSTLTDVANQHRERLLAHIDALPALAESIGSVPDGEVMARVGEEYDFLVQALIPHMASVEETLYPELDRLLSCRLAMTPMAREHEAIRGLVDELGRLHGRPNATADSEQREQALARVLRQLHDVVDLHLREESRYVPLLEHNLGASVRADLAAAVAGPGRGDD